MTHILADGQQAAERRHEDIIEQKRLTAEQQRLDAEH